MFYALNQVPERLSACGNLGALVRTGNSGRSPNLGRACWHPPKPRAARINLTGHCFIQADVVNGALSFFFLADILYLSRCVRAGSTGGRWAQAWAPLAGLGAPGAAAGDPVAQERVAKNKSLLFPVIFK